MKKTCLIALCLTSALSFFPAVAQETVATFENLELKTDSWWRGADTGGTSEFISGPFRFVNTYTLEYDSWNGFAYSNVSQSDYDPEAGLDNQYRSAAGGGAQNSATFAIGYTFAGSPALTVTRDQENGMELNGVSITNSTYAHYAALNGDSYGLTPLEKGDFVKLHITGLKGNDTTASLDFYLADYRNEDPDEHYLLDTWQWVDLSSLGNITALEFSVSSSKQNQYGEMFPSYFCMDNLNATPVIDTFPFRTACTQEENTIAYDSLFGLKGNGKYRVEIQGETDLAEITATENGLAVTPRKPGSSSCLLKATRNGQTAFVCLTLQFDKVTANRSLTAPELNLYPVPARYQIRIDTEEPAYTAEIFNLTGQRLGIYRNLHGSTPLPISHLSAGTYLLRVSTPQGSTVRRFVVID